MSTTNIIPTFTISKTTRERWTFQQRNEIRGYAQANPGCSQQAVIHWAAVQWPGKRLNQATCSVILSKSPPPILSSQTYQVKRGTVLAFQPPNAKRTKVPRFGALEEALFEWQQLMQLRKVCVSALLLQTKALEFWNLLPQYANLDPPVFSEGWVTRFKSRFSLRKYNFHGEGDVEIDPVQLANDIAKIQQILIEYHEDDIYNMDETGLNWRQTPSHTLATEPQQGPKSSKERMTVCLGSNMSGSDKLPLWVIGHALNPRSFKNISLTSLMITWRANKTAWNTTSIMLQWLIWFQRRLHGDRKVVLILDGFRPHINAVNELMEKKELPNVRVVFLPSRVTDKYQPMDMGIIKAWKARYRQSMMKYICREIEKLDSGNIGLIDPYASITTLHAVQWAVKAWGEGGVTSLTIQRCFIHSTLKVHGPAQQLVDPAAMIADERETADLTEDILESITLAHPGLRRFRREEIAEFIDQPSEVVQNSETEEEQRIIDAFSPVEIEEEVEVDALEARAPAPPLITHAQAVDLHEQLELYRLQNPVIISSGFGKLVIEGCRREKQWAEVAERAERVGKATGKQARITDFFRR